MRRPILISLAVSLLVLVFVLSRARGEGNDAGSAGRAVAQSQDSPCQTREPSVEAAAEDVPFSVLAPDADEAAPSTLDQICVFSTGGQEPGYEDDVVLRYDTGVTIFEEYPSDHASQDSFTEWARSVMDAYPNDGHTLTTVRGVPSLQIQPTGPSYGGLYWVEDHVSFKIQGDGELPLDDLVAVADSMKPVTGSFPSGGSTP
jgi:hypothetical protein